MVFDVFGLGPVDNPWRFKEVFAGEGRLSSSFNDNGWSVGVPLELFAHGTRWDNHDAMNLSVRRGLVNYISEGWCHMHFGLSCSSFSRLNVNLNRGSCTKEHPLGLGAMPREMKGNNGLIVPA